MHIYTVNILLSRGLMDARRRGQVEPPPGHCSRKLVQSRENKAAFTTVLTGDFSFPDREWNDQVERLEPQAVHVTHGDIGFFSHLKTGSSRHWVKRTTAWEDEATEGRAAGNSAS